MFGDTRALLYDLRMFETDRLILRRWRSEDSSPFADINADKTAMRFMPSCLTRTESDQWIKRIEQEFEQDGFGLWALELKESNIFIGLTGLNRVPFEASFTPAVEIGWRLAPLYWGRGLATEAAREAIKQGFETFGLREVVAETAALNMPSRRVMNKIGMRFDPLGNFLHPRIPAGDRLAPHVLYRALVVHNTRNTHQL